MLMRLQTSALGMVPVAVFFELFPLLVRIGPTATAEQLRATSEAQRSDNEKIVAPLCLRLIQDTMFAMAGLGFVDLVDEDTYRVNAITKHIVEVPSAVHGMLHFTTEPLFASAFFMRQLIDTHFEYPFREKHTPTQWGYHLLGDEQLACMHTYSIMALQGRMQSFQSFMEGKFGGKHGTMPERMARFGYDLDAAIMSNDSDIAIVDVGGGRGEMLMQVKKEYPYLKPWNLVLLEYYPGDECSKEVTAKHWDFKSKSGCPVQGPLIFSLTHVFHNLSDFEALRLMRKLSDAMAPYTRLLIHEFSKNSTYGKMHATMIQLYAGRVRSSREWKELAELSSLEVTFEVHPTVGEGLVEMRKVDQPAKEDLMVEILCL
jgi:hypothetical protein